MRLQDVISSRPVIQLGLTFARYAPRSMGYGLARIAANVIARQKPEIYKTVRSNLRQVVGATVDDETLHEMAWQVFYHAGQTYYDFFHAVGLPRAQVCASLPIPDSILTLIQTELGRGRGVLLLGIHMSNFDLGILTLGAHGFSAQVLSLADPGTGFRFLNRLRAAYGLDVTPITPESLRAAIRHLKAGGLVLAGADRPIPQDRELIEFFGRPAYLPVGSARLALMTGATVFLGSCHYEADTGYIFECVGPIEIVRTADRRQDVLINTRRIARIVEERVQANPTQWMMFHPFWPDLPAD
ncbi:MAG TPA: hypothetical protein ENN99_11895 [Chloroflexi bacterium]|nr:hypothetical protein [Chloroflexota bacterium]